MNEWLANLSNLVGVLSAAGLLGGGVWLYRRENKRIKRAEASKAEADLNTMAAHEWKEIAENREAKNKDLNDQIKSKDVKIESLYEVKGELQKKCNELENKLHQMEVERIREQIRICNRPKCADREPQTGF